MRIALLAACADTFYVLIDALRFEPAALMDSRNAGLRSPCASLPSFYSQLEYCSAVAAQGIHFTAFPDGKIN
jgi:hypothetical protein